MPRGKVAVKDHGWDKIKAAFLKEQKGSYTTVGIHEDAGAADNGMHLAQIGAIQEYGVHITVTPKMRGYLAFKGLFLKALTTQIIIPERSFLRGWVDENKAVFQHFVDKLAAEVIDGKITVKVALGRMGEHAVSGIKERIVKGIDPANHPFTIENKGSSKPLVDTGRLVAAITHKEVVK